MLEVAQHLPSPLPDLVRVVRRFGVFQPNEGVTDVEPLGAARMAAARHMPEDQEFKEEAERGPLSKCEDKEPGFRIRARFFSRSTPRMPFAAKRVSVQA